MSITAKVTGIKPFLSRIKEFGEDAPGIVDDEMTAGALEMVRIAKRLAPVDEGLLRNEIGADVSKPYLKEFYAAVFYSAYVEFGIGAKVSIPAGYADFAAKYRGKANRGNVMQFYYKLVQWVIRKGISGTYSVKTRRRSRVTKSETDRAYQIAYVIMISIFKNGIRPRPFFIPAFKEVQPKIVQRIVQNIRKIK